MREPLNIKVPQLRFPEFSGEWEPSQLRDRCSLITKGTTPKYFVPSGSVTYVKLEAISECVVRPEKCLSITPEVHEGILRRSRLEEGDLLLAIAGATVGKLGVVDEKILPANTNQALAIIRTTKNFRQFLVHQMQSDLMSRYIDGCVAVGAQPNLSLKQVGDYSLAVPLAEGEQQKIAEFLTAVDEKIGKLKRKKVLLEAYKKGAMQKLFSQEIRFKDDQGKPYPDWEEKRLGEVARLRNGYAFRSSEYHANGRYQVITISHVQDGFLEPNSCPRMSEIPADLMTHQILKESDILMSMTGNVGRVCMVPSDGFLLNQRVGMLDISIGSRKFIFQNLRRGEFKEKMKALAQGGAQDNLSSKSINKARIPFPSLPEQQKIAEFLTGIDDKINAVTSQIDKAAEFKKGLLQKMFV